MKKFELTSETKVVFGKKLFRVRALVDFLSIKRGDLGGFVERESNLDHSGNAWVHGNAQVCDNARVHGDARVHGNARVCDNAWVHGDARVCGNAWVHGDARVCGNARVSGDARVCDNAQILWVSKVGSELGTLTAFFDKNKKIVVTRGCFYGTIEDFENKVIKSHGLSQIGKEYAALIAFVKIRMERSNP